MMKLSSPEYTASAVSGEPDAGSGEVTLQVATPPDIETLSVGRPSHWTGLDPSIVKVTVPVGVSAIGGTLVTFALNVGELDPASATTNRLVLSQNSDADAAGKQSHTITTGAKD